MRSPSFVCLWSLSLALLLPACSVRFMQAAEDGDIATVSLFLEQGSNPNTRVPLVGSGPLILAAAKGHREVVRLLLDHGADINATDLTGWTPLHAAIYGGHFPVVQLLLEEGAQRDQRDHWYLTSPATLAESLARDSKDRQRIVTLLRSFQPSGARGDPSS